MSTNVGCLRSFKRMLARGLHGEAIGSYQGERLYHASLAPGEYRGLLSSHGFDLVFHQAEDPLCGLHTVWLARAVANNSDHTAEPLSAGDEATPHPIR